MRAIVEQPRLLRSVQAVERAVNDRSALPILANILLELKEQELVLTATDLDVGVQYRLPLAQQVEQGAVTLPARRLATIIRELPEEAITLEAKKNHTATLSCGKAHVRLQGLPAEDFPTFPSMEQTGSVAISQQLLKQLIAQSAFAMSVEETRFILNGTLLRLHDKTLSLVATDGRRLAVASAPLQTTRDTPEIRVVVPAKTIRELARLLEGAEEDPVTIAMLKDHQLLFRFGEITILSRLIDGQFPQYESVIPAPVSTTLTCDRQRLANAIRRASLMTTATSQAVIFEVGRDAVTVSKESAEVGSVREELEARYTGEPMTVAFNPEFWLDILKVLDTPEISVELAAPEKPAVVRQDGLAYVVLPMKVS